MAGGVFQNDETSEILSWLPAKQISKYRCVSKPLSSLTSDTFFYIIQSLHAKAESGLFAQRCDGYFEIFFMDSLSGVPLESLEFIKNNYRRILGSSNGLLVLCEATEPYKLYIFNPARQTLLPLPPQARAEDDYSYTAPMAAVPFAYDGIDYELICLTPMPTLDWILPIDCQLYSSREGRWKDKMTIHAGPRNIKLENPVISNGIIYIASDSGRYHKSNPYVVAINMEERSSSIMALPDKAMDDFDYEIEVVRWGDESVCLIQCREKRLSFTMWEMKKTKIKEWKQCSWVEILEVSVEVMGLNPVAVQKFSLINGNVLLLTVEGLVYAYNLRDGGLKEFSGEQGCYPTLFSYANTLRPCGRSEEAAFNA